MAMNRHGVRARRRKSIIGGVAHVLLRRAALGPAAILLLPAACFGAAAVAGCTSGGTTNAPTDANVLDAPASLDGSGNAHSVDGSLDAYSGPCTFSPDAYDLSCTTDTDCVTEIAGYYCSPAQCGCDPIGISRNAVAKFTADVAKTPLGSGEVEGVDCGCGAVGGGVCCIGGTCQSGVSCFSPRADTLAACADAGGTCGRFVVECGSRGSGPPDSCAYPDEKCCL
jgi:hypothetical protein